MPKSNSKSKPQKHSEKTEKERKVSRAKSNANLIPFKSGYDPRRNYHGRPKDHDQLRELIRDIGAEEFDIDKQKVSQIYALIRAMFNSKSANDRAAILEHGWGKVPQPIQIDKLSDDDLRNFVTRQIAELGIGTGGGEATPLERAADAAVGGDAKSQPGS